MEKITLKIRKEKTLYNDEETGWRVVSVSVPIEDSDKVDLSKWGNITISGNNIPDMTDDTFYDVVVVEDVDSKYSNSYKVHKFGSLLPETVDGQWKYLEALVTPNQYHSIAGEYGRDSYIIDIIKGDEFDWESVHGFGEKSYLSLINKINITSEISEAVAKYSEIGLSFKAIESLIGHFGTTDNLTRAINKNPYMLTSVDGFGFIRVDKIALEMGVMKDDEHRIVECIKYVIEESTEMGNTWISEKKLVDSAVSLLDINRDKIVDQLDSGLEGIVVDEGRYSTERVYTAERYIAASIIERNRKDTQVFNVDVDVFIEDFEIMNGMSLSDEQRKFIEDFDENNIQFLVGNSGSGKSTVQKIVSELAKSTGKSITLLAPTGRASQVLSNYTGVPASTIHRAIYKRGGEGIKPIDSDIILIDEASMCDVILVRDLLSSITQDNAKVVFIGDDSQLPSVGTGNFLYDCINSGVIEINRLTKVFRQDDGGILDIVTKARKGESFVNWGFQGRAVSGGDCVIDTGSGDMQRDVLKRYLKLQQSGRFSQEDIVILTPTNKGKLGTIELNRIMQRVANPERADKEEHVGGKDKIIFREGDLVMNTRNAYEIDVVDEHGEFLPEQETTDIFNGDSGKIRTINNNGIVVQFGEEYVLYPKSDVHTKLIHSWVMTIHKSQGSEYPVVIVIVDSSSIYQLDANILYTGMSRAKDYLLILGQPKALNIGLSKFANMSRDSFLQDFLREYADEKAKEDSGGVV